MTSCSSGTSHAAKQARRVAAGLNGAYNPFWRLFDGRRVGLAGHSYGAAGVSYIGQWDPRVDAIVAWDNLSRPSPGDGGDRGFPPGEAGCPAHPEDRVDLTGSLARTGKPALGMSADYFLPPTPNTSEPRSPSQCRDVEAASESSGRTPTQAEGVDCKSLVSDEYSRHGVDSGEIVLRGGSHLDFSFIPNHAFGATLRGADLIAWYTTAWFDKYVKGDPTADRRLLTDRWRHDIHEGEIDPDGDPDMFSFYHPSRLAFTLSGGAKVDCEDLRAGCPALTADDGYPGDYSYAALVRSPDTAAGPVQAPGLAKACSGRRTIAVRPTAHGARIRRVTAYVAGRRVGRARGGRLRVRLVGFADRTVRVELVVDETRHGHRLRLRRYRTYRACRPAKG